MKIIVIRFLKSKLFIAAVFFFGIVAGPFLHKIKNFQDKTVESFQLKRLLLTNGHLVNPLIGVENPEGGDVTEPPINNGRIGWNDFGARQGARTPA
ncbi:MAG: hypothetical protein NTX01_08760 [Candidatus Omnitrophica bacterium]|nr:hypothetical protein [Candidatus Omnitrophota bacterium]